MPVEFCPCCRFRDGYKLCSQFRGAAPSPCPKAPDTLQLLLGATARTARNTSTAPVLCLHLLSRAPIPFLGDLGASRCLQVSVASGVSEVLADVLGSSLPFHPSLLLRSEPLEFKKQNSRGAAKIQYKR